MIVYYKKRLITKMNIELSKEVYEKICNFVIFLKTDIYSLQNIYKVTCFKKESKLYRIDKNVRMLQVEINDILDLLQFCLRNLENTKYEDSFLSFIKFDCKIDISEYL